MTAQMPAMSHQQLWKTRSAPCAVAAGDQHGHLVAGHGAEADVGEAELGGDGVDDDPLAVERVAPEVEEDGNLDELDDGVGERPTQLETKLRRRRRLVLLSMEHPLVR